MTKVLIAEFKQETATFNPVPTCYDDFRIVRDAELLRSYAGTKTELAGAMNALEVAGNIELVPILAATAVSGGPLRQADFDRLLSEFLERFRAHSDVDGAFVCLHGAMVAEHEDDPEGLLLRKLREVLGDRPIVASLDLHAVLTLQKRNAANILVPYHTYPHVDQYSTGERAARNLLRLLARDVQPRTAVIPIPMLVRGDELLTATGLFGNAMRMCQSIEASSGGLAAGVIIGNAFTDVPELQSYVLVTTDGDLDRAQREAEPIAEFMWRHRHRFQAHLTPLSAAIATASQSAGLTILSDGADATASGASGDSNAILRGLIDHNFAKSALIPLVDAPAVNQACSIGVGEWGVFALGGSCDSQRFRPLTLQAKVRSIHDGNFRYEDGTRGTAGRAAVLDAPPFTILVTTRPVYVVGRRVFTSHGLDPTDFDLLVVKSPNGYRTWYESLAARMIPVDVPGATSANLKTLPYRRCVRPIFPLDDPQLSFARQDNA